MSFAEQSRRYYAQAMAAGLGYEQADALRRDAQRLTTLAIHECNGTRERAEGPDCTGPDGAQWRGTQYGDNTQIARVHRVKH